MIGRVVGWWPFTRTNQLVARADAGAVIAQSRVGIPSNFLFRTGGDTTVRGYAFESLGVQQGDAVVGGRYYAVASVEVDHWVNETWGLAAFVDAGNATDSMSGLPVRRSATASAPACARRSARSGSTSRTARKTKQVRVHFSVGLVVLSADADRSPRQRRALRALAWTFAALSRCVLRAARGGVCVPRQPGRARLRRAPRGRRRGRPSHDRRRGRIALVHRAHRAHRVDGRRDRRRGARDRARRGRRSISCRASSSCRASAPSACRSTSRSRSSSATGLPATLALPLEVDVRNIGVERLDWRTGDAAGLRHRHHVRLRGRRARARDPRRCASSPNTARSPATRSSARRRPIRCRARSPSTATASSRAARRISPSRARSSASRSTPRARCATRASR